MSHKLENKWKCVVCNKYYLEKVAKNKRYNCCNKKMKILSDMEKHYLKEQERLR